MLSCLKPPLIAVSQLVLSAFLQDVSCEEGRLDTFFAAFAISGSSLTLD